MSNYSTEQIKRFVEIFAALANEHRLQLVLDNEFCPLAEEGGANMDTARSAMKLQAEWLGLAPSTVSHHLKELRRAGLIDMRREGRRVMCNVNADLMQELADLFASRTK